MTEPISSTIKVINSSCTLTNRGILYKKSRTRAILSIYKKCDTDVVYQINALLNNIVYSDYNPRL